MPAHSYSLKNVMNGERIRDYACPPARRLFPDSESVAARGGHNTIGRLPNDVFGG